MIVMKSGLLLLALLLVGVPAHGVPASNEKLVIFQSHQISPLILPDHIRRYTASLNLDDNQRSIAEVRYEAYLGALDSIVEQSTVREKKIRKRLDGILTGRYRASPEEINQLRIDLEKSRKSNWKSVDEQLNLLLDDIAAISPDKDPDKIARARFDLYRQIYLEPFRLEESDPSYSGEGMDLFLLVKEASLQELRDVPEEALQPALSSWQTAMYPIIRSNAESEREAAFRNRVSAINKDSSDQINIMIERSKRWSTRQSIDYQGFITIYSLCSSPQAAADWTARYRRANYPWLWISGDEVECIAEWIFANGEVEQIIVVDEVLSDYLANRESLRLKTEAILAQGRGLGANLNNDISSSFEAVNEPRQELMKNSGQRTILIREARAQLEHPLSPGQRAAISRLLLGL